MLEYKGLGELVGEGKVCITLRALNELGADLYRLQSYLPQPSHGRLRCHAAKALLGLNCSNCQGQAIRAIAIKDIL